MNKKIYDVTYHYAGNCQTRFQKVIVETSSIIGHENAHLLKMVDDKTAIVSPGWLHVEIKYTGMTEQK